MASDKTLSMKQHKIKAILRENQDGRFSITGDPDHAIVPQLLKQSLLLFQSHKTIIVEFSGIQTTSSVLLALLIEWIRYARTHDKSLMFVAIPDRLILLAKAVNVWDLLEKYTHSV